jgi:DNA-binding beta-propeller fold protein YncE/cytochrome c551/c552
MRVIVRSLLLLFLPALVWEPCRAGVSRPWKSPSALVARPDGACVYVAEADARTVVEVRVSDGGVLRSAPLPASPSAMLLSPDGARLFVALAEVQGRVVVLSTGDLTQLSSWPAGHTPSALALSADGRRLFVCNRFDNSVQVLETGSGAQLGLIPVPREPIAAVLGAEGTVLAVANHLPAGRANGERVAAEITLLDANSLEVLGSLPLPSGSTSLRGAALSPDGNYAYVTHIIGRFHHPTTQLERGWINTNALSIVDLKQRRLVGSVLLDDVEQGAGNPWGVACSPDGALLAVTHAGSHELSLLDRPGLHAKMAAHSGSELSDELSFTRGIGTRLPVGALGPRAVCFAGGRIVVASYFEDCLVVFPSAGKSGAGSLPRQLPLGPKPRPTQARLGEIAFNDARRCYQKWQSCASCHPDARTDGLNWDLMNDGFGNAKNTKSMLLAHEFAPSMWLGVRKDFAVAVRAGFKFIQFAKVEESVSLSVETYLRELRPVPSPRLIGGGLSPRALRGKALFDRLACGACHSGPLYTDQKAYALGTTRGADEGRKVVTPSLIEVWRTAPYLHDGSAATLREVLVDRNIARRHGDLRTLSDEELEELIEFVLSL